ncbi:rhodanese-like domain-containing protein 11, chloroplastic isoform X2 [Gossypium hirsutum]|uniref:Rhodanese-like domain-containing protein 11, chloroplastic isoform X1 n=1 Tax=Gossypium hirsutum TaxID=3635 RepID=A0ABM2Z910_GOSHI|nr:rhodanese-like domain-containing protein 11, chloroplastic isoform X1 [Gossypium hirsutum]XP_040939186.1 rhodanese-like domain-containing protein 11, chloroplastic isoform X2 [Gossypium hirsutum]
MASLAFPSLSSLTISRLHSQKAPFLNSSIPTPSMSTFKHPSVTLHRFQCGVIRMQAGEEDFELKQMRDMAAAKKRWDAMIREGKVKILTPREAGYAIQLSNKPLLDVRPSSEREKAWVKGSTWVPIFEVDNKFDVGTLSRKATNFVMGGWWSGVPTLSYDSQFLSKVEEKFPKDAELIVTCQKGLRSLAACELLCNAGYKNLFWVQGGLEAAEEEDLAREGTQPLKFAGIGGLSEFLGNTVGRISRELKRPEKAGVTDYSTRFAWLEFLWLPMPCSLVHSKWVIIFRIYGLTKVILIFLKIFD